MQQVRVVAAQDEKMSPPQFIPTEQPKPRENFSTIKIVPQWPVDHKMPDARRVYEADFVDLAKWLVPKLMERYPRATPEGIHGWLKSASVDRMHAFFRHKDAAALFCAEVASAEPRPIVRGIFCKLRATRADSADVRKAAYEQAYELHRMAVEWAKSIKAIEFRYGENSDIPGTAMYDAVANAAKKEYYSLTL